MTIRPEDARLDGLILVFLATRRATSIAIACSLTQSRKRVSARLQSMKRRKLVETCPMHTAAWRRRAPIGGQ